MVEFLEIDPAARVACSEEMIKRIAAKLFPEDEPDMQIDVPYALMH